MSLRFHEIAEHNHRILNPFTHDKLMLVGEICQLNKDNNLLDLCCGKAEMLSQWSRHWGIQGIGVDISATFLKAARQRADELGITDRITLIEADASQYQPEMHSFDIVSCIGASWIGGGLVGTLKQMRSALKPDGLLLVGEPYWIAPPPDTLYELMGVAKQDYTSLDRIVLAALTTPSSIMDNTPMLDLARWARFRWQLEPAIAVGDAKYGTVENIVGLEQDGLCAYMPVPDHSKRTGFYPPECFDYVAENDCFICPQGHKLPLWSRRASEQIYVYRADAKICDACPVKSECTDSKSGRHLRRSFDQEYLDRATHYRETEDYRKAMRKRQVWVEPMFGEVKQWHQGRRFRLRRLRKVNIEGLLRAAGQNIKRLLKQKTRKYTPDPPCTMAISANFIVFSI